MIKYTSPEAYALLYSTYNEIDIFVEDSTLVGLYERMFKDVYKKKYRVEAITALGPKRVVLEKAAHYASKSDRKRIFIVDGDFDWCWKSTPKIRNLVELNLYSIENFIFDDAAILSLAADNMPDRTAAEVRAQINIPEIDRELLMLLPLMKVYALVRSFKSSAETVNFSLERFRVNGAIDPRLVRKRFREIYKDLSKAHGLAKVINARKRLESNISGVSDIQRKMIAGKHYGVSLLIKHLQLKARFRGTREHFISALVGQSTMSLDPKFRSQLRKF